MRDYLKRVWPLIKAKMNRKRMILYALSIAVGVVCLVALFVVQDQSGKKAEQKFRLATSYYQQAKNSQKKEERLDKLEKAKTLYEAILSNFWVKDKRKVLFYLGSCLYSLGEYEKANQVLKKFEGKYADDYFAIWAVIKLASSYEQSGSYQEAISSYQKLLQKYPESSLAPQALLGVARCQELQGERDKALRTYEELLSRYPLSEKRNIAKAQIQRIKAEKSR
ncbi:MAG: tol-pal system YbgF family protein [bacterium]